MPAVPAANGHTARYAPMSQPGTPRSGPQRLKYPLRLHSADLAGRPKRTDLWRVTVKSEDEEEDVIDLGAPRKVRAARSVAGAAAPRAPRAYTPNPRLYPGPQKRQVQTKQKRKKCGQRSRKSITFRRPVPNSRLYRPAPPKPPPPPAKPRTVWHPPVQGKLETASRVALRLNGIWRSDKSEAEASVPTLPGSQPVLKKRSRIRQRPPSPSQLRKLIVKLPAAAGDGNPSDPSLRYRPTSQHFRARELGSRDSTPTGGRVIQQSARGNMEATPRHSTSPEDCSEGNDPQSAPSEFLAEFLSAIMRRQYAEALKYCRLILQYEPRNATARGFYPLLQQKLAQQSPRTSDKTSPPRTRHQRSKASRSPDLGGVSSGANSGASSPAPQGLLPHEVMEQEADSLSCSDPRPGSAGSSERSEAEPGLGSVSSQSSLELDSSAAHSSPSLSLSRRTDSQVTLSSVASEVRQSQSIGSVSSHSSLELDTSVAHSSLSLSLSRRTDNLCDAENNQPTVSTVGRSPRRAPRDPRAARAPPLTLQSEQSTESLRRLRAQFTCSIK
ncbi:serine/arginine repetitive matrix protein 1 [Cydia strobilella]|uniref:serine/arginine repetitive matrix protein 1 n=1 Tax=Cydia strobilella TaxID=1100964 RepID=UPI003003CC12